MTNANTILKQLGGSKFLVMTGANNFLVADITETNKEFWVRMNLTINKAGVNRLKIILKDDDTYTMKFYRQIIKNYVDVVISKEQTFEGVYSDMLQEIFTSVTGQETSLGTMGR